jgi:hypothetical protein
MQQVTTRLKKNAENFIYTKRVDHVKFTQRLVACRHAKAGTRPEPVTRQTLTLKPKPNVPKLWVHV